MRIGFMSDLHLEFRDKHPKLFKENPENYGDVLILAGDTVLARYLPDYVNDPNGRSFKKLLEKFEKMFFDKYTHVFMIAGNHEHYNNIYANTIPMMKKRFEGPGKNVKVFDNDFVDIDGVRFIGSTLWCDFHKGNPISMDNVAYGMNDFRIIYKQNPLELTYVDRMNPSAGAITPSFILSEHNIAKQYIAEIASHHSGDVFVFTHHAPTYQSSNRDRYGLGLEGGYCSDLSEIILDRPNIKYWVHGHTHYNVDYMVGDCRVVSNQCGYASRFAGDQPWEKFTGPMHVEL